MKNTSPKAIALILLICLTVSVAAFAAPEPASECLRSIALSCSQRSGGGIEAAVSVTCNNEAQQLGIESLVIEEYRNGSWVVVASKYNEFKSSTYTYNTSISYAGTVGKQYRSKATVRALYNGAYEYRSPEKGPVTAIQ